MTEPQAAIAPAMIQAMTGTTTTTAMTSLAERRTPLRSRTCARLLLLAAPGLLARVLASQPVYAQPPPATPSAKPAAKPSTPPPQKPGATRAQPPAPKSAPATEPSSRSASERTEPAAKGDTASTRSKQGDTRGETTEPATTNGSAARAPSKTSDTKASGKTKVRSGPRGKKAISIEDDFLIEGKLEKPNAYYILRRSSVDFDWARLDARFSPLVLESVQDPLF